MGLSRGRVSAESLVHDRGQRPRNDAGSNGLDRFVTPTQPSDARSAEPAMRILAVVPHIR